MDQDVTWYGGRPRPRVHCARWGPSYTPSQKGCTTPQFSALVCCGQTSGWIKMALGTKVGLGPGRIVLHGDQAPPPKRGTAPNFRPMSIVDKLSPISATAEHLYKRSPKNGCMDQDETWLEGRPRPRLHYIYIFGGSCPVMEFCQVQNSVCVQVLRFPIFQRYCTALE